MQKGDEVNTTDTKKLYKLINYTKTKIEIE